MLSNFSAFDPTAINGGLSAMRDFKRRLSDSVIKFPNQESLYDFYYYEMLLLSPSFHERLIGTEIFTKTFIRLF